MAKPDGGDSVKSAVRTLQILETVVGAHRPMPAHEIGSALAIPVSSLAYLLNTLVSLEYLRRDGRLYAPGAALARLGVSGSGDITVPARRTVRAIRDRLNETVGFFVIKDFEIEAIASEIGHHALRYTLEVGQRAPLHAMAAGKALLASFDDTALATYFNQVERTRFTPNTLVDEIALRNDLRTIRSTGLARTWEEYTPGICSIGKAVVRDGVPLGAFSIAVPAARFTPDLQTRIISELEVASTQLADSARNAD